MNKRSKINLIIGLALLLIAIAAACFYFHSKMYRVAGISTDAANSEPGKDDTAACLLNGFCQGNGQVSGKGRLSLGDTTIQVDFADDEAERQQGLSGRKSLADDQGLFFIFPADSVYGFWMKDMLFSIDIIWIDAEFNVISVTPDLKPETYPKIFYPEAPARYVLEVPAGFASAHWVVSGSKVSLSPISR